MKNKIRTTYDPKYWRAIAHPKVRKYSMKTLWNKLLDWIVQLKFPFYFDDHFSTVAWRWHGGYGRIENPKSEEWYLIKL